MDLYRLAFNGKVLMHKEIIVEDLARTRHTQTGSNGLVYRLLESDSQSMIVLLVLQVKQGDNMLEFRIFSPLFLSQSLSTPAGHHEPRTKLVPGFLRRYYGDGLARPV